MEEKIKKNKSYRQFKRSNLYLIYYFRSQISQFFNNMHLVLEYSLVQTLKMYGINNEDLVKNIINNFFSKRINEFLDDIFSEYHNSKNKIEDFSYQIENISQDTKYDYDTKLKLMNDYLNKLNLEFKKFRIFSADLDGLQAELANTLLIELGISDNKEARYEIESVISANFKKVNKQIRNVRDNFIWKFRYDAIDFSSYFIKNVEQEKKDNKSKKDENNIQIDYTDLKKINDKDDLKKDYAREELFSEIKNKKSRLFDELEYIFKVRNDFKLFDLIDNFYNEYIFRYLNEIFSKDLQNIKNINEERYPKFYKCISYNSTVDENIAKLSKEMAIFSGMMGEFKYSYADLDNLLDDFISNILKHFNLTRECDEYYELRAYVKKQFDSIVESLFMYRQDVVKYNEKQMQDFYIKLIAKVKSEINSEYEQPNFGSEQPNSEYEKSNFEHEDLGSRFR